jgi:hypothetical protein
VEAKLLQVTTYLADGWTWHTEQIRNPTWDDVEAAVCRLDRFHYPFAWLYRTADPEEGMPPFSVAGGEGEFAMDSTEDNNSAYYRYFDASRGDEMIEIWTSDQGATFEAKYCCQSLDTVLRATRYFHEHGTLDPSLIWRREW